MSDLEHDPLRSRLAALFREELHDNLGILTAGLAELERGTGAHADQSLVQDLFRAAHGLKGAAHSAGVTAAVGPCHRLEEILGELRVGERVIDDELLGAFATDLDALGTLDQQLAAGAGQTEPAELAGDHVRNLPSPQESTRARVPVQVLDELLQQAGALVTAIHRAQLLAGSLAVARDSPTVGQDRRQNTRSPVPPPVAPGPAGMAELLVGLADEAAAIARELGGAAGRVATTAQQLRMQPLADVTAGLDRTVRELCRATGKQAQLVMSGDEVEVDRDVAEAIREPLVHLVRNAVDHGLEPPDERARHGKSPTGTVELSARLVGDRVTIVVTDDGAGVDVEALRALAAAQGAPIEPAMVAREGEVDEGAALELAFLPGVSTASAVTEVSGRGVGLDAVRGRVESLGGTVQLRSDVARVPGGAGTEVTLQVPVTLAVIRALLVTVGDELIGLPAETVQRIRQVSADQIEQIGDDLIDMSVGRPRPAVPLSAVLGLARSADDPPAMVVELADADGVLLVDRVDGEVEGLLHRLPPRATGSTSVLGALILPGDRGALVLNPTACLRAETAASASPAVERTVPPSWQTILLVEDTLTTRALQHSILEGAGYRVLDASDGVQALDLLSRHDVDLVVSDVDMPNLDGIELCRSIRASTNNASLPVVLVTSLGTDDDRRRGLEAGANAYLVKSAFDQDALLDAVRRLL